MVGRLCFELVVEGQLPLGDEPLDVLREVVDVLAGLRIEFAGVVEDRLVASGAGHDHVLGARAVRGLDGVLRELEGKGPVSGPYQRGGAAPFFGPHRADLDAGARHDGHARLGDLHHPVGCCASCEEYDVGDCRVLHVLGPPGGPSLVGLAVGVVVLLDLLVHGLVGRHRPVFVLDEPVPHVLPEFHQVDVGMAYCFAVPATGAFVHCVHELRADCDLPAQKFVFEAHPCLVQLVQVVYFSPGGHRLPRSLSVGLAHGDAVTALNALRQLFLDPGELYRLGCFRFNCNFHHWSSSEKVAFATCIYRRQTRLLLY